MSKSVYADNHLEETKQNDAWTNLFALVPEKSKVLDIGCSSGNFGAELIKKKQCTVIGVDIFDDDLEIAKKHLTKVYKRNIELDNIDDLGKFDVILMADVIEHLLDPSAALIKVKKQLKREGRFVFSVPNMANISTRLELLKGRFEYTAFGLLDETHVHYYDKPGLERVLTNAGLSVIQYNNTIRDVPKIALDGYLKDLGLSAQDRFYDLVNHIDAITFQFIGYAHAGDEKHTKISSKTPHDFVSTAFYEQHQLNKKINKRLNSLQEQNKVLSDKNTNLLETLQKIYNSKSWKLIETSHKALHKIRKG